MFHWYCVCVCVCHVGMCFIYMCVCHVCESVLVCGCLNVCVGVCFFIQPILTIILPQSSLRYIKKNSRHSSSIPVNIQFSYYQHVYECILFLCVLFFSQVLRLAVIVIRCVRSVFGSVSPSVSIHLIYFTSRSDKLLLNLKSNVGHLFQ